MGERKVLNKYYPPDFDPAKLPKLQLTKDRQYVVRLMAPFTMRCRTCGNYIWKGKKFNARKENAIGEVYLGIQIYRFYIRCPQCLSEITFKTDPENTDYAVEHGAYRTFQAEKLAELEEERLQQEREEDEANNPMLALENRTKESRREMDVLDALEDIRDWNARNAQVKFEDLMERHLESERKALDEQEKADEALVKKVFGRERDAIRRLNDDADGEEEGEEFIKPSASKKPKMDITSIAQDKQSSLKHKQKLAGLVVVKKPRSKDSEQSAVSEQKTESLSKNLKECGPKPTSLDRNDGAADLATGTECSNEDGGHANCAVGAGDQARSTPDARSGAGSLGLLTMYSDSDDSD